MAEINPMKVAKKAELIYIVMTNQTRIKGYVHIPQRGRLSDLMNYQSVDKPFLAVTDATLVFPNGDKYDTPFITVNRSEISVCFPASGDLEESNEDVNNMG